MSREMSLEQVDSVPGPRFCCSWHCRVTSFTARSLGQFVQHEAWCGGPLGRRHGHPGHELLKLSIPFAASTMLFSQYCLVHGLDSAGSHRSHALCGSVGVSTFSSQASCPFGQANRSIRTAVSPLVYDMYCLCCPGARQTLQWCSGGTGAVRVSTSQLLRSNMLSSWLRDHADQIFALALAILNPYASAGVQV